MSITIEPDIDTSTDFETKTKQQPPYAVVVINDNDHTFDYVIITFQKVFGYEINKCIELAETIHKKGRAIVWSGSLEVAELKREQIISAGPDTFGPKKITWPLKVELEPQ